MRYVELQVTSNFSFLRGASHPEELVEQAAAYGYKEIAITDRNSLAGIVRAHAAARKFGIRIIPGCRLDLLDGASLLAYPTTIKSYSLLCNLLSKCLKSISFKSTPPAVTNSSLKVLFLDLKVQLTSMQKY